MRGKLMCVYVNEGDIEVHVREWGGHWGACMRMRGTLRCVYVNGREIEVRVREWGVNWGACMKWGKFDLRVCEWGDGVFSEWNVAQDYAVPIRLQTYFHKHCNTLQHTATHCNTLQHTATHCNTLQHTAARTSRLCLSNSFTNVVSPKYERGGKKRYLKNKCLHGR